MYVIKKNQAEVKKNVAEKPKTEFKSKPQTDFKTRAKGERSEAKKPFNPQDKKKQAPKVQVVEKVQYKNGKNKKS
jgi:hypothetical protein